MFLISPPVWTVWRCERHFCLNSVHNKLIDRQGGREKAVKRCRFSLGFLGCSEALDLCVWLIAFHINHRYWPGASLPILRRLRKQHRKGAQWRRGTSRCDSCVCELAIKFTLTAGPLRPVCVCVAWKEWKSDAVSLSDNGSALFSNFHVKPCEDMCLFSSDDWGFVIVYTGTAS